MKWNNLIKKLDQCGVPKKGLISNQLLWVRTIEKKVQNEIRNEETVEFRLYFFQMFEIPKICKKCFMILIIFMFFGLLVNSKMTIQNNWICC